MDGGAGRDLSGSFWEVLREADLNVDHCLTHDYFFHHRLVTVAKYLRGRRDVCKSVSLLFVAEEIGRQCHSNDVGGGAS